MKRIKHFKEKISIESRDGIIALWIFMACYLAAVIYFGERGKERQKEKNKETSSVNTKVVNKKENLLTYQYCKKNMSDNINIR